MSRAHFNVFILAVCQALAMTGQIILATAASLVGYSLAPVKALATLPQSLMVISTMAATIPASLLMARIGRRGGFTVGAIIGIAGASTAATAIFAGSFAAFCAGTALLGLYNGGALFYRFAAADTALPDFRAKAISLVMAGGVAAALFGPEAAKWSRNFFEPVLFAGCFALIACFCAVALGLVQLLRIPRPPRLDLAAGRSLATIARQPAFRVAVASGMIAYAVMSLVMTATPLAMVACDFTFEEAAFVIQWHALGMFAPSFVTGHLITRFGLGRVMATGALLLGGCIVVDLTGISLPHFWLGLILLGIGWNFLFVGASTMVTQTYAPAEKAKAQAANDFCVFGLVSVASFSSGALLSQLGWVWVNLAVVPPVLLALGILFANGRRRVPVASF